MKTLKSKNGLSWEEWEDSDGVLHVELTGEGWLTDHQTAQLKAEFLDETHFELLVSRDCNVYMPAQDNVLGMFSSPLSEEESLVERLFLVFRKGAFSPELCEGAYKGLRGAARPSKNRGVAGGKVDPSRFGRDVAKIIPVGDGTRARYITKDGLVSDTVEANTTMGGIAGYYPPTARNPYARPTAYTRDNWDLFEESWPYLKEMTKLFSEINPIRYSNQKSFVEANDLQEWVIPGTLFSTITVNKNFQTACHQDAGDLKQGFENFGVLESGPDDYVGGYTVFPKFRLAFDCRHGDFAAMDVAHHWHGNCPIEPAVEGKENFERISLVCYIREDLAGVGSKVEEGAKYDKWVAKRRTPKEQHSFRVEKHLEEKQKDADFMDEFGA